MRYQRPVEGQTRIRRIFHFLPTIVGGRKYWGKVEGGECRWLCFSYIEEVYVPEKYEPYYGSVTVPSGWYLLRYVDADTEPRMVDRSVWSEAVKADPRWV